MSLRNYILRRLLLLIPILLGVLVLVFIIAYIMPVDPARAWAGPKARKEQLEALRERYHLNDPLYMQIYYYLRNLFRGDLGVSATTHRPVLKDLSHFFPATFERRLIRSKPTIRVMVTSLGIASAKSALGSVPDANRAVRNSRRCIAVSRKHAHENLR